MTATAARIILVSTGCDLSPISDALGNAGATVAQVDYDDEGEQLAAAVLAGGRCAVVQAHMPEPAMTPVLFRDIDENSWQAQCEAPLRRTICTTLAARQAMLARREGGAIIGLGPGVSLVGAPLVSALTTSAEGQRSFLKAAARQSLTQGIFVNWVAVNPALLLPELAQVPHLGRFEVGGYGRNALASEDIAPLIIALAGAAGKALAGQTLIADGGDWMLP